MKKVFLDNIKRIIALLLIGTMIMSPYTSVFADDIGTPDNSSTTESDEKARERECMPSSPDYLKKLLTYLKLKYPEIGIDPDKGADSFNENKMATQTEYDTIEIDGSEEAYSDITKNMVQFRYLGCFGAAIGSDESGNQVYSNTVKTLIIRNVDEIRNLYVPASVETLIIENTTLNCYHYENDSPGFQCGMNPGDLKYCNNLKKLVLRNVKFGDNYKRGDAANLLPNLTGNCPYEKNYVLNLQNCTNLEELEIDVSFEGAREVQLAINGGTNQFEKLTQDKCKINPAPGTGWRVNVYADTNSNLAKYYSSSETAIFNSERFKLWLLEGLGVDTNNDGVISQVEMDAIETLTINDTTAHNAPQTSLSAFQNLSDISKMRNLKTLNLDYYDPSYSYNGNRQTLKSIAFPASLENLNIKNVYWENDDLTYISLTNLKTLELNNTAVNDTTQIHLKDTGGVLKSCIIEGTNVKSITLENNSNGQSISTVDYDRKQRISFSAPNCQNLESIEFLGEGYAVEGSLDLTNDTKLTHIGVPENVTENGVTKTKWTIYGEFNSSGRPVNVTLNSCSMLGSDCDETVVDYAFIQGKDLNVQTMNTTFGETNQLIIKRDPKLYEAAGNVYLSCDKDRWIYNKYREKDGFVIEERSSFPTIAVFSNGQRIRTAAEGAHNNSMYTEDTDLWVERWDLVMQPGGYSNGFGNLTYYVVDEANGTKSLRRVFYSGDVYAEWEQQNCPNDKDKIITLPTNKIGEDYKLTGSKLSSTGKSGEVELKLYVYEKDSQGNIKKDSDGKNVKSYIGYQNIKVFEMPDSVELVNDGTASGSGTKDDPYVINKNEELKLKARLKVKNAVDPEFYALRDIYWRIKEYDETPRYTSDSDSYSLYTLDSATKAGISVVRGADFVPGETVDTQYDRKTDDEKFNHRRFSFNTTGSKFKIVAQSPYKFGDKVITSEVYVVYNNSEKPNGENPGGNNPSGGNPGGGSSSNGNSSGGNSSEGNSTSSTTPVYTAPAVTVPAGSASTSTIPVYTIPVEPVKDPMKPTLGVSVIDNKSQGVYVIPDLTKNEVVYTASPADYLKKTITIPDAIVVNGKKMSIVKIDPGAFKNNQNVKTIKIGKNIKVIGSGAFEGATNLTKVTLGKNVEIIGEGAFKNCANLTTITIPSKTKSIGTGAFEGDVKLKNITIGKNVESIGVGAFKDCTSLTSISLPGKVTTIGIGAFDGCTKLKTIKITSTKLTSNSVAIGAFYGLTNNTIIKVPKSRLNTYKLLFAEKGINPMVKIKRY